MYVTARNSLRPLGLEERVELVYKIDGSSTFFAETCLLKLQVPVVFDSFHNFYQQFIFAVDYGYRGFGCVCENILVVTTAILKSKLPLN